MSNQSKLQQNFEIFVRKSNVIAILQEFQKLQYIVEQRMYDEILGGLTRLLLFTYKMGIDCKIDLDEAVFLIHNSNMSKLCATEKLAKDTVAHYVELYNSDESPYDTPEYGLSDDGKYYIVRNASTNKILKSIDYVMVDLKPLVLDNAHVEIDNVTNLQKVIEFNKTFNATIYDNFFPEILDDTNFVDLRLGLIREEIDELVTASENNDMVEIVDALGDILYVVYGMVHTFGYTDFIDAEFEKNLV